jgi:hypothetical protein
MSLEALLLSSPPGFLTGSKQLISLYTNNNNNKSQFAAIVQEALNLSSSSSSSSPSQTTTEQKEAIKILKFIFKALTSCTPKVTQVDAKAMLEKSTLLPSSFIDDILKAFYSAQTSSDKSNNNTKVDYKLKALRYFIYSIVIVIIVVTVVFYFVHLSISFTSCLFRLFYILFCFVFDYD